MDVVGSHWLVVVRLRFSIQILFYIEVVIIRNFEEIRQLMQGTKQVGCAVDVCRRQRQLFADACSLTFACDNAFMKEIICQGPFRGVEKVDGEHVVEMRQEHRQGVLQIEVVVVVRWLIGGGRGRGGGGGGVSILWRRHDSCPFHWIFQPCCQTTTAGA